MGVAGKYAIDMDDLRVVLFRPDFTVVAVSDIWSPKQVYGLIDILLSIDLKTKVVQHVQSE